MPINVSFLPPRRILPIIFVIDSSDSMRHDGCIETVNQAMRQTVANLNRVARNSPDVDIRVAVLTFGHEALWMTRNLSDNPALVGIEELIWEDLECRGPSHFARALQELNENMTRRSLFSEEVGYKTPVIIFVMSGNGYCDEWKAVLGEVTARNKWLLHSRKVGIGVGELFNERTLARIIMSMDEAYEVSDVPIYPINVLSNLILHIMNLCRWPPVNLPPLDELVDFEVADEFDADSDSLWDADEWES